MTRFVGLGVSQKITAVCIAVDAGRRPSRGQCPSIPEQIGGLACSPAGDDSGMGIETKAATPRLVHGLRNLRLEAVYLNARHALAALKMRINKTDRNGAEGLARIVRTGRHRPVHVKSLASRRARAHLGARGLNSSAGRCDCPITSMASSRHAFFRQARCADRHWIDWLKLRYLTIPVPR